MNTEIQNLSDDELDAVTGGVWREVGGEYTSGQIAAGANSALLRVVEQMNHDTVAVLKAAGIPT